MSEALNIVKASFGGLREVTTSPLWQYDYGQILKITGLDLPQAFEVHFSNSRKSGETVTQIGADNQVTIPDMFLTSGADVYAFIFLHDGLTDGETKYIIKIPVKERPEPSDIEPTPEQQDAITEAIAALNVAVTQTGQDVISADASAQAASQSAGNAAESERQAGLSAQSADNSKTAAEQAQAKAEEAQGKAEDAQSAAELAQGKAEDAKQDSETAKREAEQAAGRAEQAAASIVPVDATLKIAGRAADAKVTGDRLDSLTETVGGKQDTLTFDDAPTSKSANPVKSGGVYASVETKISKPLTNPMGTNGQLLRTLGNGQTEWTDQGLPTDEQTAQAVSDWLDEHPEATTTVQDGAVTWAKLNSTVQTEIDSKAPAIMEETTSVASCNTVTNEHKVNVVGNGFTSETIKIANVQQLHIDAFNTLTSLGITYSNNDGLLNFDGTATANISAVWVMSANRGIKIPSAYLGKTVRFYIKSDKPCTIVQYANGSKARIAVRLRQTGVTGDGREAGYIYFDGGVSDQIIDSYVDINTLSDDDVIYFIFRYLGEGSAFDDVNFYAYLYPVDAEIYDTEETVAEGEAKQFDIPTGYTLVDTGVHKNALYGAVDTKDYVDFHIPSNVVTTEALAEYVPNEKNLVYVTPEMFGAVGDATTDDAEALQDAIDYAVTNNVAMRAFGHYKTMSPLVLEGDYKNIYIHDIDYRGTGGAGFILRGVYNYIRIDRLYAFFSTGAGFTMETNADIDVTYNEIHLGCVFAYTNGIECINNYGTPETGNRHFYYNRVYVQQLVSRTANCIYLSANKQLNENSFWGKHISNGNGYFVYCSGEGGNSYTNRFYEFCIESSSANGVYGMASLINCRTGECRGLRTAMDVEKGRIFVFDSILPFGVAINTDIDYICIDVSNARSYADSIEIAKTTYEAGNSLATAFDVAFPKLPSYVIGHADAVMTYMIGAMGGDYTISGDVFAYFNHKGYIPMYDWYYTVNVTEYHTWETDHCFPTIFDIKADTTIYLDDSYCAIGIKNIKIIQTGTERATIYDHNNIKVFDGASLGAGTYILHCDLVDPDPIVIETSRGTITGSSRMFRGHYFGYNEVWSVEKLNIV